MDALDLARWQFGTDPAVAVVAVSHQPLPIVSDHGETKFHALGAL